MTNPFKPAAEATGGYPFMIQLVGYHAWRQGKAGPVTTEHVRVGVDAAGRKGLTDDLRAGQIF